VEVLESKLALAEKHIQVKHIQEKQQRMGASSARIILLPPL
jgi:hypothetical protein